MDASHRPRLRGMPRIITRTQGQPRFLRAFSVFVFLVPVNTPSHPKALGWGVSRGFEIFLWRGWGHTNTHRRRRACGNPPGSNVVVRRLFFPARGLAVSSRLPLRSAPGRAAPLPPRFAPRPSPMPAMGSAFCGRPGLDAFVAVEAGAAVGVAEGAGAVASPVAAAPAAPAASTCRHPRAAVAVEALAVEAATCAAAPAPSALVPWPVRHPRARAYI
jgi:hypothetical protein